MPGEQDIISFDKYINYPLARKLAPYCYKLGIKPNHVTIMNMVFRVYIFYDYYNDGLTIKTLLFSIATHIIDSLDGTIARTYNQTSKLGAKLDIYSDLLYWPILILLLSHKYNYPNYLLNLIIFCLLAIDIYLITGNSLILGIIEMNAPILIIVYYHLIKYYET